MPPPPAANNTDQEFPLLSDEDISLLHNIVVRAQDHDDFQIRPKKAIFDAYDAIFAENGLHTNHDRACLRILFQLAGDNSDPRIGLFEKFEKLLLRAGIQLEVGDDQASIVHHEEPYADDWPKKEEEQFAALWLESPGRVERRNSFTSVYDVTAGIGRLSKQRPLSRASFSKAQVGKSPFHKAPVPEKYLEEARRRTSSSGQEYRVPRFESAERPGLIKREGRKYNRHSDYNTGSPEEREHHIYEESEPSLILPEEHDQGPELDDSPVPMAVSQTQLIRDSGAFDLGRIQILVRKYFRKWYIQAQEQRERIWKAEAEAVRRDGLMLQAQAFDSWLTAHYHIQEEAQKKILFDTLERRVRQICDKHLKDKAFSHWHGMTQLKKAETNAAREKCLAIKYFNAWYRLTVTQELEVERQSLKAPLQMLRKKALRYYEDEVDSLERYYFNLRRMILWRWVVANAERRAPRHRDGIIMRRAIFAWATKLDTHSEQEQLAADQYRQNLLRRMIKPWMTETCVDIAGDRQADAFRVTSLLRRSTAQWRIETRLSPLQERVVRMRDWRIARSSFGIWLLRTRMIFRADFVSISRTKQNAFTAWNERLRHEALKSRIANRLLAQTMYKWVIAQRDILMTRIRVERENREVFRKLVTAFREHKQQLLNREVQTLNHRYTRLRRSTFECWKLQMNLSEERSKMAVEFYTPKIQQETLAAWCNRHEDVKKIEAWSKDASFYFTMMKALKRWRDAAAESKKQRTHEAYKKMRRQVKLRLARKAMSKWRSRLEVINDLEIQGNDVRQLRRNDLLQSLMSLWHDQNVRHQQATLDALGRYDGRLMNQSLNAWIDASRHAASLSTRADQFYQIHLSEVSSANLRKINMKAFGIKRRQQDADAMRERHWSKHLRNIFRHWAAQSREVTYQALMQEPSPSVDKEPTDAGYATASGNASQTGPPGGGGPGGTQRAEDWTAFDADLLDNDDWLPPLDELRPASSTPMPTPGYLNTPSKRAARAKALAKMSTTPASPLPTPFAARLRAGMANSPVPAGATVTRRDGIARSGLGVNVRNAEGDQREFGYGMKDP